MRNKEFEPKQIADAAMQVFWEKGYAATSVQDLVDGTGLSRSSLYNTFDNKQNLYCEALKSYKQVTLANIEILEGTGSVKSRIETLYLNILENELHDPKRKGCFAANAALELADAEQDIARLIQENFARLHQAFERLILEGQKNGEIALDKDAKALAYFFVNTMQGMRIMGKSSNKESRRECLQSIIDIALQSLE